MRPDEYIAIARRRWWLPLLCAVLAAIPAYLVTVAQPTVYESTTRVMAIAAPDRSEQAYWTDLYAKNRLESYRQIATSSMISQAAVERGGLPLSAGELVSRVATRHNPSDNTVQLAVRDGDPVLAARAADALAETLVACLNSADCELTPAAPQVKIVRLDRASQPDQPTGARPRLNALGGAVLGLVLGGLLAVLVEYLDDVLRTPAEVQRALGLRMAGRLPRLSGQRAVGLDRRGEGMTADQPIAMLEAPSSNLAEAYRLLRTNILFARGTGEERLRSFLIAGIDPDASSDVASNLAVATAQAGITTLLVDANLRQPRQHAIFGLGNDKGLSTALTTDTAVIPIATAVQHLSLIPSGPLPGAPSELLGSTRMTDLLINLAAGADVVILDGPPIGELADGPVLATKVAGVLLVVRAGITRRTRAIEAREELERVGARVIGVALVEPNRR
jgi:capsular exopolysaccharide synthesis family protein